METSDASYSNNIWPEHIDQCLGIWGILWLKNLFKEAGKTFWAFDVR